MIGLLVLIILVIILLFKPYTTNITGRLVSQQDITIERNLPGSYVKGKEFIVVLDLKIHRKPNALIIKETLPSDAVLVSSSPRFQKSEGNIHSLLLSDYTYPVEDRQIIYTIKSNSDRAEFSGSWLTSSTSGEIKGDSSVGIGTTTILCIDKDGDGFGFGFCPPDCDDSNPDINPDALENCNDGIDNNCNGKIDMDDFYCIMQRQEECDNDGDGYESIICGGTDCDDFQYRVNPGREESFYMDNCNDGLDNDCDGKIDTQDEGCESPCNYNGRCDWGLGENPGNCEDCRE